MGNDYFSVFDKDPEGYKIATTVARTVATQTKASYGDLFDRWRDESRIKKSRSMAIHLMRSKGISLENLMTLFNTINLNLAFEKELRRSHRLRLEMEFLSNLVDKKLNAGL